MPVWMRNVLALASAFRQVSMSSDMARVRPQITGPCICCEIRRTASKSSGEEAGNPASITSTFSRANCRAISSFSLAPNRVPAACSPSRKVVSNIMIFSFGICFSPFTAELAEPAEISDFNLFSAFSAFSAVDS